MGPRLLSGFKPIIQHYSVLKKWWCIGEIGYPPHTCPYKTLPYFAVIYRKNNPKKDSYDTQSSLQPPSHILIHLQSKDVRGQNLIRLDGCTLVRLPPLAPKSIYSHWVSRCEDQFHVKLLSPPYCLPRTTHPLQSELSLVYSRLSISPTKVN